VLRCTNSGPDPEADTEANTESFPYTKADSEADTETDTNTDTEADSDTHSLSHAGNMYLMSWQLLSISRVCLSAQWQLPWRADSILQLFRLF